MTGRTVALVGVALVLLVAVGGLSVAAADQSQGDAAEYTLNELKQDGKHYSVPGARIVPEEQRVYWLEYTPANQPWLEVTAKNNGPKFASGEVLKTNTLYLRTIRAQTDTSTVNVTIIAWNKATRTVQRGNATVEEAYAANVSTMTQQITLGPGWAMGEINLPTHEQATRITMFIQEHPQTARWTFTHESVATSQAISINTWGEFLYKIALYVGLPVLIGGAFVGKRVRDAVEAAIIGPQWGFARWAITITLATLIGGYAAFTQIAQAIVYVPYLMGAWIVGLFAAYTLATHRGDIQQKGFLKLDIRNAESFTNLRLADENDGAVTDGGEDQGVFTHDSLQGEFATLATTSDSEGGISIVRPGFVPFLARIYGARSRIDNLHELTQRFRLPGSSPDEIFLVDPEADSLIEYEPPGFSIELPDFNRQTGVMAAAALAATGWGVYQLAAQYGSLVYAGAALVGAYVFAKKFVVPTDGHAHVEPAPMHFRQAFASMLMLQHGVSDAKDLDEAKREARREKLKTRKEAQDELDEYDRIMMEHLAGNDVSEALEQAQSNGEQPPGADKDEMGEEQ